LLYGGLVGMVATLVFLYLSAATLIFGAEINAVLRNGSRRQVGPCPPGTPVTADLRHSCDATTTASSPRPR
jgi:membrane protein